MRDTFERFPQIMACLEECFLFWLISSFLSPPPPSIQKCSETNVNYENSSKKVWITRKGDLRKEEDGTPTSQTQVWQTIYIDASICHHRVNSLIWTTLRLKILPLTVCFTMRYDRFFSNFQPISCRTDMVCGLIQVCKIEVWCSQKQLLIPKILLLQKYLT